MLPSDQYINNNVADYKQNYLTKNADNFSLVILFLFMCTGNLYFLPSGMPQVSHYLLFLGAGFVLFTHLMVNRIRFHKAEIYAIYFGLLTFIINIIHFTFLPDTVFLLSSFYYIYNALVFVFICQLFRESPQKTLNAIYIGLIISIVIEIIFIQLFPDVRGGRSYGTFNNPNQLSYWAVFSACLIVLSKNYKQLQWYDILILFVLFWIQTLALSKAGLISFTVLLLLIPFYRVIPVIYRLAFIFITVVVLIFIFLQFSSISNLALNFENISNAVNRIDNIGMEIDDNPRNRGYLRPIDYWYHLFLGAGEGGYSRFTDMPWAYEIHSGLVNILFCYGILGFILFSIFLYNIILRAPSVFLLLLFVILLNGLTHQNIRFTYFWITMAVAYSIHNTRPPRSETILEEPATDLKVP